MLDMDDEQVQVLNFSARLISKKKDDALRKFVVSFYLFDQTMQIFESPEPNSGFQAGKFLQKCRPRNEETGHLFTPQDFYVGAKIKVVGRVFELTDAAELAFGLMESNPDEFPESDISIILPKVKGIALSKGWDLRNMFEKEVHRKVVTTDAAKSVMMKFVPDITKHAAITVARAFDRDGEFQYEDMLKYLNL